MIDESYQSDTEISLSPTRNVFRIFAVLLVAVLIGVLSTALYIFGLNTPTDAAYPIEVTIEEGESVRSIANKLQSANIVKSDELLYFILVTQFDPTQIKASRYFFDTPLTTYQIAEKLIAGDFDTDLVSITVFEGESRAKISERLTREFEWFNSEEFMLRTLGMEGFLFPETYFIPEEFTTAELVDVLHDGYHDVVDSYEPAIKQHPLTEQEIITLASIVEREANSEASMKTVAGIFLNRMDIGMALQADASIEYVLDEGLHELPPGALAESLREIDSLYNTYLYPGLPPTPIGNPGRTAIEAVLQPTESEYFYYITGNDGNFYYAETYNQHIKNINTYLK